MNFGESGGESGAESGGAPSSNSAIEVVFDELAIAARIASLADEICAGPQRDLLIVPILKGSFIFAADLLRELHRRGLAPEVDFLTLKSYHDSTTSSGHVTVVRDLERDVGGRDVLLVDDILESGRTLAFARDLIVERSAHIVRTCVLLNKVVPRAVAIEADIVGFECPDVFVIGYGMDLASRYRELPFVGRLTTDGTGA